MANEETFSWNILTKNFHAHQQLQGKIRRKLTKLEQHLQRFPRDAVHLHIALEKHPKKNLFRAALVLRVPSNILRSEKNAPDPIPALDQAVKILLRRLSDFKSHLRREALWKRKEPRMKLRAAKMFRFAAAPMAGGTGPQNEGEVIRALIVKNHPRLLRYVRRHLWHEVAFGKIPRDTIDPRAVVDEITCQALTAPEKKPDDMGYLLWFYALARRELHHRCQTLQEEARETVKLEEPRVLPEDAEAAAGYEPERPLDMVKQKVETTAVELKELVPDVRTIPPDAAITRKELLEQIQKVVNTWPKPEREAFGLYFVEGFEPVEIGLVLGLPTLKASELLDNIHLRLRETLMIEAAAEQRGWLLDPNHQL